MSGSAGAKRRPLWIRGGHVVDPDSGRDGIADVYVGEDGRIVELADSLEGHIDAKARKIEGKGRLVLPGFVDLHTHLREPGFEYKETIATGAAAAAAGGFTTVLCMANTRPVNDNGAVTRYIVERAQSAGLCAVRPIGALSRGLEGKALAEISDMLDFGAVAVSDDGLPVMDAHLMRRALEYTRTLGVPVVAHEEDQCLSGRGCMNEGRVSTELGLPGSAGMAEDVMVARDLVLAEATGGHLHVAHVSTRGALRMIREAQERGVHVTTEVTPHHFSLTDEAVRSYDPDFRMAPPLRSEEDRQAVLAGLQDGSIAAIATDHAPHATQDKEFEFELAANGVVGLETAWGLTYRLVREHVLSLRRAVELLTCGPARAFGLGTAGTLRKGAWADLVLVDPEGTQRVVAPQLQSKSKNTPFKGWELPSRVERTVFHGRTVWLWDGEQGTVGAEAEGG